VQAITVNNGKSQIDVDKCIGCGQCEFQCPNNVITLIAQEREVMLPLQKRSEARIQA
ncbi:MAG: 4Fe-4S binding protein, partial [Deltaproteobacteria bacterium]|nr:4Fe-4S binding protein [Deltaproteobacteria bacterium]